MDGSHSHKRKRPSAHDHGGDKAVDISQTVTEPEHLPPAKRSLRIVTHTTGLRSDITLQSECAAPRSPASPNSDTDSLFDEVPSAPSPRCGTTDASSASPNDLIPAQRTAPPIPGLYLYPAQRLPDELADEVMWTCIRAYFQDSTANQVMLFERAAAPSLPPVLTHLLHVLAVLLRPLLPAPTHALLFPATSARARQAILNLYWPGEGITPHVDLLDRFGDGIVGVSLGSGCVMRFDRVVEEHGADGRWDVYLPPGSVLVMAEEARYAWTHGIERRMEDLVEEPVGSERAQSCSWVGRDVRLSITFRWLLPGADVVGGPGLPDDPDEGHA